MKHPARLSLAAALTAALTLGSAAVTPAHADDRTTLLVVGTSDVSDSKLMASVIEPGFEAAYPQYDLKYTGSATGAAIATAQTGSAAALIVHAMSLENQFVADGFSAEPYGRAIFWGDYILAGPKDDPAGVLNGASHDIVTAFEKIAAAGAQGNATFVSRGGNPGTTVQEHALWAEANSTAVTTCTVSASNGGGASPYTATGACPANIGAKDGDKDDAGFPSWYRATGVNQAANITAANACNFAGAPSDSCYVFTDRGTFQYQQSVGATGNLALVTRDNDAAARGGYPALVNTFHAYVINPNAPGFADIPAGNLKTDVTGATALLDWITSPAGQRAIGAYQGEDPSFLPSAAPQVKISTLPATVKAGTRVSLTGSLTNAVPGMPALAGVPVRLEGVPGIGPGIAKRRVATALTDRNGRFALSFVPSSTMLYNLVTDRITQTEDAALDPVFRDLLSPTSTAAGTVRVKSTTKLTKASAKKHKVTLKGVISPVAADTAGTVTIYATKVAKRSGKKLHSPRAVAKRTIRLARGAGRFSTTVRLASGTWKLRAVYTDGSAVIPSSSGAKKVRIR
jgi:tungstate transport system substrate-binding protein